MKYGMGHKDDGVDKFWLPLEIGRSGYRVGQYNPLWRSPMVPTPIEYNRRVLLRARNVASFLTRCTTMICGQYFRIMAWRPQHVTCKGNPIPPPGADNSVALLAEHPSPRPGFLALFSRLYKVSTAAGLFFWIPAPYEVFRVAKIYINA